ncbi:hypothetical protein BJP25_20320 [Actinokineospora bangkokensis]|uniref:HTH tetR-type domain-containing protein n=2 Tax=Actinokineospora bangkokensis TaxID=1193682 RepID=A0A1Q9LKY6_9PSEU|nr:hypothetical protein BJP25_20320 [Actinokineospora bangkokensis]
MIESAVTLLMERGAAGVSIDAVLARSGAPRGSVYHHFPGGRDEILLTAGRAAAAQVGKRIAAATDPRAALDRLFTFWTRLLAANDHRVVCPVVAMAVNPRADFPEAEDLVRETFAEWRRGIAAALGGDDDLASFILAALEGAIILSRAERSPRPLLVARDRVLALLPA